MKCDNCGSTSFDDIGCCLECYSYYDKEIEKVLEDCDLLYKEDTHGIELDNYNEQNIYGRYYTWKQEQTCK